MPYSEVDSGDLILRDHLALDRTVLANERTLLAYLRTALFLVVSGVSLLKLFPDTRSLVALGYTAVVLSAFVAVFGACRFRSMHKRIAMARRSKDKSQ